MNKETLRMQFLSGVITESEYKVKLEENKKPKSKKSLKENFVGMSAINNPFPERKKEKYEDAFEHFLGEKYKLNEEVFSIKFKNVEEGRTYTATTDFGIFKKGDKVLVDNIRNLGAEVVLELENTDGKTDSIKGDLEEEIEVFS